MKPYTNLNRKAHWSLFWEDKVSKKIKRLFKKSARVKIKAETFIDQLKKPGNNFLLSGFFIIFVL